MNLKEQQAGDVVVLEISGKLLGGPDAVSLNEKLHELVDAQKTKVVANLKDLECMNSTGLGILISGLTTLRNHGGDLKLAIVPERIQELLKITKLSTIFAQYSAVDTAIASFQ